MKLPLCGLLGLALWLSPLTRVPGLPGAGLPDTDPHHLGDLRAPRRLRHRRTISSASVNRDEPLYNWMSGNLGLHTAHHQRPGVHWSLLPQIHAQIKHEIPKEQILTGFW